MLYMLIVYSFNNDIRFNRHGSFNLPVGKTDLNKNNLRKLSSFINRTREIDCVFICNDFMSEEVMNIIHIADFVYADPPYLLGTATYNENGGWTEKNESDLLNLLENLDADKKLFALSNVIEKTDKKNEILSKWILELPSVSIFDIDYHYRSSSYNKKNRNSQEREVLITNFQENVGD